MYNNFRLILGVRNADKFKVILYGSLSKTGKGHGTDAVIKKTIAPAQCEVEFNYTETNIPHPNTMDIYAYKDGVSVDKSRVLSVGGGSIAFDDEQIKKGRKIYNKYKFTDIADYCKEKSIRLWEYAEEKENSAFWEYMKNLLRQGSADNEGNRSRFILII